MPKKIRHIVWPDTWRAEERAAFERGVARMGLAAQSTLPTIVWAFGPWLAWAEAHNLPRMPAESTLAKYVTARMAEVRGSSVASQIARIKKACYILYPVEDWRWLHRLCSDLWRAHVPPSPRRRAPARAKPTRCGIPFAEWPTAKQQAWEAATSKSAFQGSRRARYGREAWRQNTAPAVKGLPPNMWSAATKANVIKAYGLWLGFARRAGLSDEVTPNGIVQWVDDMDRRGLASGTTLTYVEDLHNILSAVLAPAQDWSWLAEDVQLLADDVVPKRDKSHKFVKLGFVWLAALDLMQRAERNPNLVASAHLYEAGLMLAVLVFHGLRLRNLAEMTIGDHVILDQEGTPVRLTFRTKTGLRSWDFARELVPFWHRYFAWFRTLLPSAERSAAVWPSPTGGPLTRQAVRHSLKTTTKTTFLQTALNPHLLRDILATALTEAGNPEAARHLLGHGNLKSLEPYIRLATCERAARHIKEILGWYWEAAVTRPR